MKIAIASPPYPLSLKDCLYWLDNLSGEAAREGAMIICFPETYMPGYPGPEYEREECSAAQLEEALLKACTIAKENDIAIILPADLHTDNGLMNVVHVISRSGELVGYQTKNQLDPSEDKIWQPGTARQVFELDGLRFGISICHEGFRYPETVRWAARNGAHIVFHPNCTGSDIEGELLTEWGGAGNPYYEKAQMVRALENTIYFAPSNYAFSYTHSASSVIAPDGTCLVHQPYGKKGIILADIDTTQATGFLAGRLKPALIGY